MIITQIIHISFIQPMIPLTAIAFPVLSTHTQEQGRTCQSAHEHQTKTNTIPGRISSKAYSVSLADCKESLQRVDTNLPRCFVGEEDVTGNDSPDVTKPNHHSRGDASLVMSTHVVVDPDYG